MAGGDARPTNLCFFYGYITGQTINGNGGWYMR
jgi:hypothetical protein